MHYAEYRAIRLRNILKSRLVQLLRYTAEESANHAMAFACFVTSIVSLMRRRLVANLLKQREGHYDDARLARSYGFCCVLTRLPGNGL